MKPLLSPVSYEDFIDQTKGHCIKITFCKNHVKILFGHCINVLTTFFLVATNKNIMDQTKFLSMKITKCKNHVKILFRQ